VLAYNAFVRGNRIVLAELDGFAHDVLALVITGRRLRDNEGDALRSAVAPLAASRVVR
jgi:biopolymer transport protein ExbB